MSPRTSIYRSDAHEQALTALYEKALAAWPVPYRNIDLPTEYGTVRVIASGPAEAPPVLLFHAASVAAVSWAPNVAALADRFCVYAVDHIGEAGMSRLADIRVFPRGKDQLARHCAQIADGLGVGRAHVAGASNGGFVAMSYASRFPDRVRQLALLGPMGITRLGAGAAVRMMLASMFPSERRGKRTTRWALGSAPPVMDQCGEWFAAVLQGIASPPSIGRPGVMDPRELEGMTMPVLLFLGTTDNLVGNPARAQHRARHFPNLQTEVLPSSHLIGVEQAAFVNERLTEFLQT